MSIKFGGGPKFKRAEDGRYKPTTELFGRKTERIPGGLGDKRSARRGGEPVDELTDELTQEWKEAGELADPSSTETDNTVVDLETDVDTRASLEMAEKDKDVPRSGDEDLDWDMPEDPNTLHTRQVEEAQDPNSSAYWNGRRPFSTPRADAPLGEVSMSEGERIQDKFDRAKVVERAQYLDGHAELQENKDIFRNGLRWFMMLGRGRRNNDKTNKRGHAG